MDEQTIPVSTLAKLCTDLRAELHIITNGVDWNNGLEHGIEALEELIEAAMPKKDTVVLTEEEAYEFNVLFQLNYTLASVMFPTESRWYWRNEDGSVSSTMSHHGAIEARLSGGEVPHE